MFGKKNEVIKDTYIEPEDLLRAGKKVKELTNEELIHAIRNTNCLMWYYELLRHEFIHRIID